MTPRSVLVVAPSPQLAAALRGWLTEAGCKVTVVASFLEGKRHLDESPSILISEIRLGDYNGLHLALWARSGEIPAIVLGAADEVLQREAERLGVAYLSDHPDRRDLLDAVARVADRTSPVATPNQSASSKLSFASWDELVPAVRDREASLAHRSRRTLRS